MNLNEFKCRNLATSTAVNDRRHRGMFWLALEETFWLLARYAICGTIFELVMRFVDDLLTTIFTEVKMNNRTDQRVAVFVYGKLQQGESNHAYLASAQYLGPALSNDPLSMFIDRGTGIPLVTEQPTTFITGELYLLPDARALAQIDWLEGHPHNYQRKLISVDQAGRVHKAWCYLWHHELDPAHVFLNTGNYKDRRSVKRTNPSVRTDWDSAWAA